jgi:hypothetical protein
LCLIDTINITAIIHHINGEIIQEATIAHIFDHVTIAIHLAVIHAHTNQPIIECVAETGALK